MTYDHWKTTNPDEQMQELPMDDQPTELDLAYERIKQLEAEVDHWMKRALALKYQPPGGSAVTSQVSNFPISDCKAKEPKCL